MTIQTENALERGLGQVSQRMVALETKCTNDVASSLSVVEELLRRTKELLCRKPKSELMEHSFQSSSSSSF